jgi:hypothetical protein
MKIFSKLNALFFTALTALAVAAPAHADYLFSGAGTSGNLAPGVEAWSMNFTGNNNWGSPGVGAGVAQYSRTLDAYGFDISFTGATILAGSVDLGNGKACIGSVGGGTTFCTFSPTNIWVATQTDDHSISFRAQNAAFAISTGQQYFVNIFFDGATPTGFTGRWLTEFSPDPTRVPEPSGLPLIGIALAGLFLARRKFQ